MNIINSLIIGSSSQISHYFPQEYERISSENIRLNLPLPLKENIYDRVYITFADQELSKKELGPFIETNCMKTLDLVSFFSKKANYVIVYGSCELWNNYNGPIDLKDKFDYNLNDKYTNYCISKQLMIEEIKNLNLKNIIVIHPFNFNSPYRKAGFLFSKIFDSIINKKRIEIGDTYFYRDIIHPKYVVERSILATSDELVGSGRLTFVNKFIRTLYLLNRMNYKDWVTENLEEKTNKNIFYLRSKEIKYHNLIEDTLSDIKNFK